MSEMYFAGTAFSKKGFSLEVIVYVFPTKHYFESNEKPFLLPTKYHFFHQKTILRFNEKPKKSNEIHFTP